MKDFPGARVRCMQVYVRPTLRKNPDHIIIHIGTNDLASNTPLQSLAYLNGSKLHLNKRVQQLHLITLQKQSQILSSDNSFFMA